MPNAPRTVVKWECYGVGNVLSAATLMDPSSKHDRAGVRRPQADGAVLFVGPNLRVRVATPRDKV